MFGNMLARPRYPVSGLGLQDHYRSFYENPYDSGNENQRRNRRRNRAGMVARNYGGRQGYMGGRGLGAFTPGFQRSPLAGSYAGFRIPFRHKPFMQRARHNPLSSPRLGRMGRSSMFNCGRGGGLLGGPTSYPRMPHSTPLAPYGGGFGGGFSGGFGGAYGRQNAFRPPHYSPYTDDYDDYDDDFDDDDDEDDMLGDRSYAGRGWGGGYTDTSFDSCQGYPSYATDYEDDDDDDYLDEYGSPYGSAYGSRYGSRFGGGGYGQQYRRW